MEKLYKLQEGMQGNPLSFDPQMLSQMMSAQGAGQGIDFNGEPTPNVSGEPSFADMYQEIKQRYDVLIEPLERKLRQLYAKLKENPTDSTIRNEIERIETKIDKLEQQEDMELQQLEAEVQSTGEQIEAEKQIEGYGAADAAQLQDEQQPISPDMEEQIMPDGNGEMPMMQKGGRIGKKQSGNEAWERSNTVTLPWPYFAKNPLFDTLQMPKVWQLPEMSNGLPKFRLPDVATTTATTTPTHTTTNTTPTTTENTNNRKKWLETFKSDLAERPLSDYTQIGLRLGEMASNYGKHMAELIGNNKITGNPYRRNIDSITQAKSDALNDIRRYFDTHSVQNRRDLNRALAQGQYGSLANKTAFNNAVYSKFNEYAEKMNTERANNLSKTGLAYDEMLDKAHTQYNEYENAKDMYNRNNMISMLETLNKSRNAKLERMYEAADFFSKATQDQRDYNFIMGPYSNNYLNFLSTLTAFQNLSPKDKQAIIDEATKQNKSK